MRDPDDRQHFGDMLRGLAVAVKGGQVTTAVLEIYWMRFKSIPRKDFDKAIGRASGECDYFPSLNELLAMAGHKQQRPGPAYLQPADNELERIETCSYHVEHGGTKTAPISVPWCRKCRRLELAATVDRRSAATVGELLQVAGVAPLPGERR